MTTETGAGQWGAALAMACTFYGLDLEVYMVKVSYEQKPYRRYLMETYGAQVFSSPSDRTAYGRSLLAKMPDTPGSLGIAISEAVEVAAASNGTKKYGWVGAASRPFAPIGHWRRSTQTDGSRG